jgi:hypothetical protein
MVAVLFIIAGVALGFWRARIVRKRPHIYSTSPLFTGLMFSMVGLGLATGMYLLVIGIMPINKTEAVSSPLISLSETLGTENGQYFIAQNTGDDGRVLRSFISNRGTQTLLRNDIAIPSSVYEGDFKPHAVYTTSYVDYPWLFPFSMREGGYLGQSVDLYVPSDSIYYGFHLEP